VVRYWLMEPADAEATFVANAEVDAMRWVRAGEAAALLSYPRDAELVAAAAARLDT